MTKCFLSSFYITPKGFGSDPRESFMKKIPRGSKGKSKKEWQKSKYEIRYYPTLIPYFLALMKRV